MTIRSVQALAEEQDAVPSLAARAREVGRTVAALHADAVDRDARFPHEAVAAMKAARMLGSQVPLELGGEGASLAEVAQACQILGQSCAAAGMVFAMHHIKLASLVNHGRDSAWHRRFMARVAKEQLLIASSTTEAGIGGDLRHSICAVERTGDRFALVKDASVISYGAHADAILVTARRDGEAAGSDQVLIAVTHDQYRLEKTAGWDTLGMRGTCSEGFMLHAEGPVEQIFPKPFADIAAQSMLASSHLLWSSLWLGIASDAVARAQAFVRQEARKRPGTTPPGATRLAEAISLLQTMKANVEAGLARFAAAKHDPEALSAMGFAVDMNTLKVSTSRMVVAIVQQALMICGIAGYKNGTPYSLGRHLRDAFSAEIMISNDRILSNTATMLLVHKHETEITV
jgi:acyl-CoA dehydrogenase